MFNIEYHQLINHPIDKVFMFFSKPENLEIITPENLHFKILTPSPVKMSEGSLIDYKISLMGMPFYWKTIITHYDPPNSFIDKQIKGPYSNWIHTHKFIQKEHGTVISDRVNYSIPLGFLGKIIHALWIKKELENIFIYRQKQITQIFK